MKKLLFEMFLIVTVALCISLLYNMLSPSGLRILPKKTAASSMQRTERVPLYAYALSHTGVMR